MRRAGALRVAGPRKAERHSGPRQLRSPLAGGAFGKRLYVMFGRRRSALVFRVAGGLRASPAGPPAHGARFLDDSLDVETAPWLIGRYVASAMAGARRASPHPAMSAHTPSSSRNPHCLST